MSLSVIASIALLIAGFLAGGVISEYSLRGVEPATQGQLLSSLSSLRIANLIGVPAIVVLAFVVPSYAWWLVVAYFSLVSVLAVGKLWRLDLPRRLRNWQTASVGSVYLGVLLAAGAANVF